MPRYAEGAEKLVELILPELPNVPLRPKLPELDRPNVLELGDGLPKEEELRVPPNDPWDPKELEPPK